MSEKQWVSPLHFTAYKNPPPSSSPSQYQERELLLDTVDHLVRTIILHDKGAVGPLELRMWLFNEISLLTVDQDTKRARLHHIMDTKYEEDSPFMQQLLLIACQKHPREVMQILLHKGSIFRDFFRDNPERIEKWFHHFKFNGKNKLGALALERFLFDAREDVWAKLRWSGKRDIPPCVVVQKKNLFLQMDVTHAVQMLAEEEEDFWTSIHFQDSIASGDILSIDYVYFVNSLKDFLRRDIRRDEPVKILAVIDLYLQKESFKEICQQLLRFFEDAEILNLIYHIIPRHHPDISLVEYILSECKWKTMEDLLVYNAIATHANTVISHLVKDDELLPIKEEFNQWLLQHLPLNSPENATKDISSHWSYRQHLLELGGVMASSLLMRFILLEGFLFLYRMKSSPITRIWMETFYRNEGIEYQSIIVEEEREEKHRGNGKHKHKKRRRSPSSSPPPPMFVGWKFKEDEGALSYGINEAPQYLYQKFVNELRKWFVINNC